jgi:hypothetical protein
MAVIAILMVYRVLSIETVGGEGFPLGLLPIIPSMCLAADEAWWLLRSC